MRRIGRHRRGKQKKILIIGTLSLLLFLCAGYAAFSTNLGITAKGNIKEKSRVIQAWDANSGTDFHSDFYRQHVVSATFLDNNNIPSNATESWNVSEDKENGAVMAWVVPNNNDNTKYDLYIGAPAGVIANEDSSYLFYDIPSLRTIDLNNNFDTKNSKKMNNMFASYYEGSTLEHREGSLTNIYGLDSLDTSNVESMRAMFRYTSHLSEIDLSKFKTSNVVDMFAMFELSGVKKLDLSSFDTRNVINMGWMFSMCNSLTELNVSTFNTSKVTQMDGMFAALKVNKIDLSHFDTSNVINMSYMFGSSSSSNLALVSEITGLEHWNTSKVTNMSSMFKYMKNLTTLNLCGWNTSKVTNMRQMFDNSSSLQHIYVGNAWETDQADTTYMFSGSGVSSVTTGQC